MSARGPRTNPIEKVLKTPLLPPGTKVGPMGLPISYCTKDYKIINTKSGKSVRRIRRRVESGANRYSTNKLLDGDPIK